MKLRLTPVPVLATVAVFAALALPAGCAGRATTSATPSGTIASPTSSPSTLPDNGISALTAPVIFAAARATVETVDGMRGTRRDVTPDGVLATEVVVSGENSQGKQLFKGKLDYEFIQVGEDVYVRGTREYYRQLFPEDQIALIGKRWAKVDRSVVYARYMILNWLSASSSNLRKGQKVVINGVPAIEIIDDTAGFTYYVATTGTPYPFRIASAQSDATVDFSHFGELVTITAPPPSSVIEPTRLPPPRGCAPGLPPPTFKASHAAVCP